MKRKSLIYAVVIAIILVATIAVYSSTREEAKKNFDPKPDPDAVQVTFGVDQRITAQKRMETDLLKQYKQGSYSLKEPFVVKDPYGVTPLTALIMFKTDEPMKISLTVEGKDDNSDVKKRFTAYKKNHEIPVLGLYPDYENTVIIKGKKKSGDTITKKLSIQTNGLPDDFLITKLVKADTEKMENGLTFIIPSSRYVYAVDENAEVRWYSTLWNSHVFTRLDNGNLLYITIAEGQDKYNDLLEMDMLGRVLNEYHIELDRYPNADVLHHDAIELPNGNLLATTHDMDSDYIEDEMIEIDRKTGETLRGFNFRDIFPESFYQNYDGPSADEGDWLHHNSIWFAETDNKVLITSRHQDLAMKFSYPDGKIDWILAVPEKWPDDYQQYLLEPKGDVKYPAGPHAVMTLPDQDDNDHTTDILLYDNNIVITRGNEEISGDYSRAVQYRVNEKEGTVQEVWSYGEERGEALFSSIVGDADYLKDTGNRLITYGYIEVEDGMNSRVIEVSDQDPAEVIYEIVISGFEAGSHRQAYRAERMPLYPEVKWDFTLSESK